MMLGHSDLEATAEADGAAAEASVRVCRKDSVVRQRWLSPGNKGTHLVKRT